MLIKKSLSVVAVVLVGLTIIFTNCSLNDEKKESGVKNSGACFLIAEPALVAPGESAEIKPGPGFSWDQYRSVTVEGVQTLTSASTKGAMVTPGNSRSYPVTAIRTDGTQTACEVAVKVDGKDFDAACTLIVDPSTITAAQDVNVSLQVSGTEAVESSYVNGIYLGGAAGGSKNFSVVSTTKFTGVIAASDGRKTECLAILEFKNPTASGDCKVEPSAEDKQKNVDANAKYDVENTAAQEAKFAAVAAGRSDFVNVFTKDNAGFLQQESLCLAITGTANAVGCALKTTGSPGNGFLYAQVDVSGQLYEVYGYRQEAGTIKVVQETDGTPTPIPLAPATEYVEEIEIEICECVYSTDVTNSGVSADIAQPVYDFLWYPIASGKRSAAYQGEVVNTYVHKAALIQQKKVQPPAGIAKPECPQDWNQAT